MAKLRSKINASQLAGQFRHREMGVMLVSDLQRAIGSELFNVPQFT